MTASGYVGTALVSALLALGAGCAGGPGREVSGEQSLSTSPSPREKPSGSAPGSSASGAGARVTVPSHCGVLSVRVNGRLWLADPPLGDHNPPPGWDENATTGRFVRTGAGRGEFRGDEGQRAVFRRAAAGAEDPNAGCE